MFLFKQKAAGLEFPEFFVETTFGGEEFIMSTLFRYFAVIDDYYPVHFPNGWKPVGDNDGSLAFHQSV